MQSLPYEILQHVASSLLPRSQCRLAMTSKWCYRYLYSYLLRWHAKWHLIPIPKHNIIGKHNDETLLFTGKNIVLYNNNITSHRRICNSFNTSNLSTRGAVSLVYRSDKELRIDYRISIQTLYNFTTRLPKKYLNAYRKYLHKDILLIMVNRLSIPHIDRIDCFIFENIYEYLSDEDIDTITTCEHLTVML